MNTYNFIFQNLIKLHYVPSRAFTKRMPRPIQYCGFKYYPRTENFEDPPYTPSKLFLIKRIKSMKGTTKKEKRTMAELNIDGEARHFGHINVVKNIPEINAQLWKIKHLIAIKPVRWTGDLEQDSDFTGTILRETGELIISPKLEVSSETAKATEKHLDNRCKLTGHYLKNYLKAKWLNGYSGSV